MDTPRNLLFAALAFQNEYIDLPQFGAVCRAWAADKTRPLASLLVDRGWIGAQDREHLERLVERKLNRYGGDVYATLGAVADGALRDAIRDVDDPDVQQSISSLPPAAGHVVIETLIKGAEKSSRYTLSRLHAQGGLGKVWIARDGDLGRDVVLKELKPERAQHPEAWRRFLKEAQVTGQLEHPNIVPVYELAHRPQDNQPFYTMKFVRGQTLRDAIADYDRRRREGTADALELPRLLQAFVGVCNAIGYAHSRGVIHRDLKPENVVLGDYGEVIVLDWGLAKLVRQKNEPHESTLDVPVAVSDEAGQDATLAGRAIGTAAYMPPEQAEGRLDLIDARTDIYGLGAILFAILTGRPPHRGADTAEILQRIIAGATPRARDVSDELLPPTPLPPTGATGQDQSIAPHKAVPRATGRLVIPPALDAICYKAMAKERSSRYSSAAQLAEDVQRWLADEQVSAWLEPLIVRARRWVKRHPRLVAGTSATVLLSLVSLATIASIVGQSNRSLAAKNSELEQANQREREATSLAQQNARKAHDNAEKAETNAAVAREQSQLALKTLESVIFDIQAKLENVPGAGELRRKLLHTAIARLQQVSEQFSSRLVIDRTTAVAFDDLGEVFLRIGSTSPGEVAEEETLVAARKLYEQSFQIFQALAAAHPTDARIQHDLFVSHIKLGNLSHKEGQVQQALKHFNKAMEISQKLAAADPRDAGAQRDLSSSYAAIGDVSLQAGQLEAARQYYDLKFEIDKKLADADPMDAQALRDLSNAYERLGNVSMQAGQIQQARGYYQRMLEISKKLAAAEPTNARALRDLSSTYDRIGDLSFQTGEVQEAHAHYQSGLEINQKLAAADPADAQTQRDLSSSYNRLGNLSLQAGQLQMAFGHYEKLLAVSQELAASAPMDTQAQRGLLVAYNGLGEVSRLTGHVQNALEHYRKGLEISQKLAGTDPTDGAAQRDLSISYNKLGDVSYDAGQVQNALEHYQKGLEISRRLAAEQPADAQAEFDLYACYHRLGLAHQQERDYAAALIWYEQALGVLRRMDSAGRLPPMRNKWIAAMEEAISVCQAAERAIEDLPFAMARPPQQAAELLLIRATVLAERGQHAEAAETAGKLRELAETSEPSQTSQGFRQNHLYNAACCYGLAAAGVAKSKSTLSAEDERLRRKYADQAVATLRAAVIAGYKDFAHLQKDPDLGAIREHPGYKELVEQAGTK